MIKIDLSQSDRNAIADKHWNWVKNRFNINSPQKSQNKFNELKNLLGVDAKKLEKLIKANLEELYEFAQDPNWAKYTIIPSEQDCKKYKKLKKELEQTKKDLKQHGLSPTDKKNLQSQKTQLESSLSQYQSIIDREKIFSLLGYDAFKDDGAVVKIGEKKPNDDWGGYDYCLSLNLKVCPYCNREYINTVDRIKLDDGTEVKGVRPDFDHFFPKDKYPFLSCSIFNLIPACKFCNQQKSDKYNDGDLIHPFTESFSNCGLFKIDFQTNQNIDNINIEDVIQISLEKTNERPLPSDTDFIKSRKQNKATLIDNSDKAFQITRIYNTHQDELGEFITRIRSLRGTTSLSTYAAFDQNLINLYQNASGQTKEYAKKILLGIPINIKEYPLRKLREDILKQVGL